MMPTVNTDQSMESEMKPGVNQRSWLHQSISLDTQSITPSIFVQPSSPNVNLYKRGNLNRIRSKSGDGNWNEMVKCTRDHEILHEEEHTEDLRIAPPAGPDSAQSPPLPSPTKRVTFMERVKWTRQNYSADSPPINHDQPPDQQNTVSSKRRVRKWKTLDVGEVQSAQSPRSPVVEFFNQIRIAPNAPWRSSSVTSAPESSTSSASSSRPRSFTLGLKQFSFRQLSVNQDGRKSSRQQTRNADGKEKRKRTRSYSFRAPSWLNVNKPKIEQQNSLRTETPPLKPIIRRRSISANNINLLVIGSPGREIETIGLHTNRNINIFQELLSNFTCYDLMPQQAVVIGMDIRFTGRQALQTLANNDARVALLWDFNSGGMVGVLSASDLLQILIDHQLGDTEECQCQEDIFGEQLTTSLFTCDRSKKIKGAVTTVGCEASIRTALSLLIGNRYHRLPVINSKTGDVLYFITKNSVLRFLMNQVSNIPPVGVLRKTVKQSNVGKWKCGEGKGGIIVGSISDTLMDVVKKILTAGISTLPLIDKNGRLVHSLAKGQILNFLISEASKERQYEMISVEEMLGQDHGNMVTCSPVATIQNVLDLFVKTGTHQIYIMDSPDSIEGVVTISDILSFLVT